MNTVVTLKFVALALCNAVCSFSLFPPPQINSCLINFLKATLSRLPTTKMLKRLFKNWAFPFLSVRRSALLAVPLLTSLRVTPGKCSVLYLRCTPH